MRILALILIICILGSNALASSNACVNLFLSPLATTNTALRQQKTEYDILNRYINSLSLMPQIKGRQHPRVRANQDLNQLGIFQREIEKQFPIINEVIQAYFKLQQNLESVTFEQYKVLRQKVLAEALMVIRGRNIQNNNISIFKIYGTVDAVEVLSKIYSLLELSAKQKHLEKEQGQNQQNQNKNQQDQQDQPSTRPFRSHERSYKPKNKDLSNKSESRKSSSFFAYMVNSKVPMKVLRETAYEGWDSTTSTLFSHNLFDDLVRANNTKIQQSADIAKIDNSHGSSELTLVMPYGKEPIVQNYGSYEVIKIKEGSYSVISHFSQLPAEVIIYLKDTSPINYSPAQLKVLTHKSGIQNTAWPQEVLRGVQLAREKGNGNAEKIAEILSDWFRIDGPFLYYNKSPQYESQFQEAQRILKNKAIEEPEVLARARAKMFNCDGAAEIGMLLLRDFFGLPTRFVSGWPVAGKYKEFHVVNLNNPGHAWVEVLIGGKWVPFDFTPSKNNPEGQQGASRERLQDSEDPLERRKPTEDRQNQEQSQNKESNKDDESSQENFPQQNESQANPSQSQQSNSKQDSDNANTNSNTFFRSWAHKAKNMLQIIKDSLAKKEDDNNVEQSERNSKDQSTKENKDTKSTENKSEVDTNTKENNAFKESDESKKEDDVNKAENDRDIKEEDTSKVSIKDAKKNMTIIGREEKSEFLNLSFEDNNVMGVFVKNVLIQAANRIIERGNRGETLNFFTDIISKVENIKALGIKALYDLKYILDPFYLEKDKALSQHLTLAQSNIYIDPTITYDSLLFIKNYIKSLQKFRSLSPSEQETVSNIDRVLNNLLPFRHVDSSQHKIIESLVNNMPGEIIRGIFKDQYPEALKIGSPDQVQFFNDLKSGKWVGAVQAYLVNKHFNFLLNSELEYSLRRVKSLIKTRERERDNADSVLADIGRPDEIPRWDLSQMEPNPNPIIALLSKAARDEQYMYGHRVMMQAPRPHNPIEKKVSLVYYDISGSMHGKKARVQASAIAAVVDKALSEKDPFGNPLHTVVLVPFGSEVYQGITVKSVEEARKVVLEFVAVETRSNDGTEFQPIFDHFFASIHKYSETSSKGSYTDRLSLKKANMILMTDGGARLDYEKIKSDLQNLPKEVQPFFNLVLFEKDLAGATMLNSVVSLVHKEKAGAMLTDITSEQINNFISESNKVEIDPNAFVFEPSKGNLPASLTRDIMNIRLPSYNSSEIRDVYRALKQNIRILESNNNISNINHITSLEVLIEVFKNEKISDEVRIRTAVEVLKRYKELSNLNLDELSLLEHQKVMEFISAVENGPKN